MLHVRTGSAATVVHLSVDTGSPRALPEDGDPARVPAEPGNVLPGPLYGELLIPQPHVAAHHLRPEGEEAKCTCM